jgi:hypothetical protein
VSKTTDNGLIFIEIQVLPLAIVSGQNGRGEMMVCVERHDHKGEGVSKLRLLRTRVILNGNSDLAIDKMVIEDIGVGDGKLDLLDVQYGTEFLHRYILYLSRERCEPREDTEGGPCDFGKTARLPKFYGKTWVPLTSLTDFDNHELSAAIYHKLQSEFAFDECFACRFLPNEWSVTDHRMAVEGIRNLALSIDASNHRKFVARLVANGRVRETGYVIETTTRPAVAYSAISIGNHS